MNLHESVVHSYSSPHQPKLGAPVDEEPDKIPPGLSQLVMSDQETFVSAMADCKQKSWLYFFPLSPQFLPCTEPVLVVGKG